MSEADVATVHRFFDSVKAGDAETALAQLTDDVIVDEMGDVPHTGTFHGPEGFGKILQMFGENYSGFELDVKSVNDAGDFIVGRMTMTVTSKNGEVTISMPITEHYTMRDNKICHVDVYYKNPEKFKLLF